MRGAGRRLSYANVVSTLALFIALGGATAFAATQLPKKSVGAPQLRPGAVTASKLRKNAVTAPKIKALAVKQGKVANGAIGSTKLADGAVTGGKLASGAVTGEKIAAGAVTGAQIDESSLGQVPSAAFATNATNAGSANPVLFARVNAEGKVDAGFSKGIFEGNVTTGTPGIYCVSVPGFNPRGAQVTAEFNVDGDITAYAKVGGTNCPAPKVEVRTFAGGSPEKEPFYLVLYQ